MTRKALFTIFIALAGALLAGCGTLTLTSQQLQFALEGSGTLGYEATPGIVVETRNMRFRNASGAPGVTLTGYQIEYFDASGAEVKPGDNMGQVSMNLFVPPGIQCDEPDPVTGCTVLSEGWRIAPGPQVITTEGFNLLPAGIALLHLDTMAASGVPDVGWYAEITFFGFRQNDFAPFTTVPYKLHIAPPN